jgi:hypothetical protein
MTASEIINHIDPAQLEYSDWVAVGMALKHDGGSVDDWDSWSQRDSKRYVPGDCGRKWTGFNGSATPLTVGTLVELAKQQGWTPPRQERESRELDWNDCIGGKAADPMRIIDPGFVEDIEVQEPDNWNPVKDLSLYLSTLFSAEEYVGYVTESWTNEDGRHLPKKGSYTRTAGELLNELSRCKGDLGKVIGDYNPEAGAWIRFNPLDGHGIKDSNVTAFRYALVESDILSIERQAAIYEELELPIAALVHSGKKSLHAIVRVNATTKEEYRERVNFLYSVCQNNGLVIDGQNKNVSRLSRMPGIMRNGQKQYVVAVNQGKESWEAWKAHVEEANDNLPDFEPLSDVFNNLPALSSPLIDGLLREGHKMLVSGPSKAGKSYLLLQLAIAIAEGKSWLGWPCAQGRVLYVNLELDRASALHRLKSLYDAHGLEPLNLTNIDLWNLRGKAVPLDLLAPKLIRRAIKRRYKAVIIDPIYKVLTGSENEADDMARFCNQFDKICAELGAATIYCHHHSKGTQGQKNSRDRSSGSGVFARDPDAILDIIELIVSPDLRKQISNRAVCDAVESFLNSKCPDWRVEIPQDDALVADKFIPAAKSLSECDQEINALVEAATARAQSQSGWRIEGTLREFAPFDQIRVWFRHPIHVPDTDGLLVDAKADGEENPFVAANREWRKGKKSKNKDDKGLLLSAYNALAGFDEDEDVRIGDLAEAMDLTIKAAQAMIRRTSALVVEKDGRVLTKTTAQTQELEEAIRLCTDLAGKCKTKDVADKLRISERTTQRRIVAHPDYDFQGKNIIRKEAE